MQKISSLKKLAADKSGQFSIMLAVALPMLVSATGFAVDLSNQQRVKFDLQNATDAAVLAATDLGKDGVKEDEVRKRIRAFFLAACPVVNCAKAVTQTTTITGDRVRVDAYADVRTYFMGIAGYKTVGAEARSEITISQEAVYYEVHMLLDNTGSMNIVDGLDNIRKFRVKFEPWAHSLYCAFACHDRVDDGTIGPDGNKNLMAQSGAEIARANNIPMREDRVRSTMIDQARDLIAAGNKERLKVAVYDFDWWAHQRLAPSSDINKVKKAIEDLPWQSFGTQFQTMDDGFIKYVGPSGSGKTSDSPKKAIILITDGVSQNYKKNDIKAIPQEVCNNLKADGRTLFVLNMVYPDPLEIGDNRYGHRARIIALRPQLEPALQKCASPGFYYRAEYGQTINNAMEAIKKDVLKEARNVYLAY